MSGKRMIHRVMFSENEQVALLTREERLLYVGMIVFADDDGRLKASASVLKAKVFPFDDGLRTDTVRNWRDKIASVGLIVLYAVGGQEYAYHPNWSAWQQIRSDRYNKSVCPKPIEKSTSATTGIPDDNQATTTGIPDDNQAQPQPNLTQPKLIKVNKDNALSRKHSFEQSPFFEYDKFKDALKDWPEDKIRDYYAKAKGYSGANGGTYLNWILAVRNWERENKGGKHAGTSRGYNQGDNTAGKIDTDKYRQAGFDE